MMGSGQPWNPAMARAMGATHRVPPVAHHPWKTLRVSYTPTTPPISLFLKCKHEKDPDRPHDLRSGSSFNENTLGRIGGSSRIRG
jgi:hypothetical protein